MALKIETTITLQLIQAAAAADSAKSLYEALNSLNHFGGDGTTVELVPDIPACDSMWCWYAKRDNGDCYYNGGLLHRDGEWSLHS